MFGMEIRESHPWIALTLDNFAKRIYVGNLFQVLYSPLNITYMSVCQCPPASSLGSSYKWYLWCYLTWLKSGESAGIGVFSAVLLFLSWLVPNDGMVGSRTEISNLEWGILLEQLMWMVLCYACNMSSCVGSILHCLDKWKNTRLFLLPQASMVRGCSWIMSPIYFRHYLW